EELNGFHAVTGRNDGVAGFGENAFGEFPEPVVVFDQKNAFGAAFDPACRGSMNGFDGGFGQRQVDFETGTDARFAVDVDVAAALLDDPMHHGQAEPGSLAALLGGEERLEYLGGGVPAHAHAVVCHRQFDVPARLD